MIHQKPEKQKKHSDRSQPRKNQLRWLAALAVIAPLSWLALTLFASYRRDEMHRASVRAHKASHASPTPQLSEQALKDTAWDSSWPPLPNAGTPAKPIEQVRAMYAFAARHAEVLQYAPCYCGCESGGHENVHDCFVKGRDANGKPQWDGMGFI
jgi:hypothetical protein